MENEVENSKRYYVIMLLCYLPIALRLREFSGPKNSIYK